MSTDHPGRPFRYGIRFKIAVSIGVIMVALMAVDILWNLSLQNAQAENEAREKAEVLAAEMRAAWDFVDMNQEVINRAEDGAFRTKHLVCVVAAKSISMLFTSETDYSIRFTNDTPRQAANAPDAFEQEALAAFNADPNRKAFWRVVDTGDGTRVFRYTEPLYVTESCLECHGDPVGELDQYGYPKEGMQVGQVGGAMSITEPMDIYAAGIQLAEYFIHGIALAGTCRAGYKGVHRQTIAVEPYCIFADTAHIENLAQQKVCAFFLLVIGDHFLAKICVLYHRKSAHRPPRQPHVDRQFVAADQ